MAKPVFAQTTSPMATPIPTPAVPTFTVELIGPSYTVPTSYSLNQSSGQIVAQIGYIVEYSNVEVTIKNQPFTPFTVSPGNVAEVYYDIQIKDHNQTDNWAVLYSAEDFPEQSADSDYTNISIPVATGQNGGITIPVDTQTDIQIQAMIGYITSTFVAYTSTPPYIGDYYDYSFVGQTSSWSATQTVTIPANVPLSPTPAPTFLTPTQTPTSKPTSTPVNNPSYKSLLLITTIAIVAVAILLAVIVSLLLYMKKIKKEPVLIQLSSRLEPKLKRLNVLRV